MIMIMIYGDACVIPRREEIVQQVKIKLKTLCTEIISLHLKRVIFSETTESPVMMLALKAAKDEDT